MVLADTNVLSTFAKIDQLALLLQLFSAERIGVVPAVYTEFQAGVERGYTDLQAIVQLVQQGQIDLVAPDAHEIFQKAGIPATFDAGELETLVVARSRGYAVLTNEKHVNNWCKREGIACLDLPGVLRALWKTDLVAKELVQSLIDRIEARDRIRLTNKEQILKDVQS